MLEARDRVGGRVWTQRLSDGTPIDRGAGWLAPGHAAALALAAELGVSTYKTYVEGAHLLVGDGRIRRYTGLIPKISPLAVVTIALAQLRIDRMAKRLPIDAPWTARKALDWDRRSVESWLARSGIRTSIGRDLFSMAVRGLMTADLRDVSLLHLLTLVRGHGGLGVLFSIEGGSQENLIDGGAGSMAELMASELGSSVRLSSPVRSITQTADGVSVEAGASDGDATVDVVVSARHAVVAIPPALVLDMAFEPVLPVDRLALYRGAVAGPETKTLVVYDSPFWRADGFSGQTSEPGSASEVTIDASPSSGSAGVLASFTFGPVADRVDAMEPADRRQAVLDALAARLGPRAAQPSDFVETPWWKEPWTRGCSMAHHPPGNLTRYGHLLREPFGRVHWAGTETATISHGAIDGAIRSGERAASEILDRQ